MDNRHAFQVLAKLGPEADRLGIRVVDAFGQPGPVTDFLDGIVRYIEAREDESDRLNREVSALLAECQRMKDQIVNGAG